MAKLSLTKCRWVLHAMSIAYFILHSLLQTNMSPRLVASIVSQKQFKHYNWNLEEQATIVLCINYFSLFSAFPGGHLAQTFGTKTILGCSTLAASFITLLNPIAAYYDFYCLMAARIVTSILLALNFSAFYPMAVKWTSPEGGRSVFVSHMMATLIGYALVSPLCKFGVLFFWESVFYISGILGLVWTILWFYFVFDSPLEHPRIKQSEILDVQKKVQNGTFVKTSSDVPWERIVTCVPVWASGIGYFGEVLGFFVIYNYLPVYYEMVYSFKMQEWSMGLLDFQHVGGYFSTLLCCVLSEKLIKTRKISKTTTRKIFSTIGLIGTCLLLTFEIFFSHTVTTSLVIFTIIYIFLGISVSSLLPNILDLVPVYSGSVFGVIATFTSFTPYISHKLINFFIKKTSHSQQDLNNCKYVFIAVIVIQFISAIIFLVLGSGNVQNVDDKVNKNEMISLTEISRK